jgi:hypothetical protein
MTKKLTTHILTYLLVLLVGVGSGAGAVLLIKNDSDSTTAIRRSTAPTKTYNTQIDKADFLRVLQQFATKQGVPLTPETLAELPTDPTEKIRVETNLLMNNLTPKKTTRIAHAVIVQVERPESKDYQERIDKIKAIMQEHLTPLMGSFYLTEIERVLNEKLAGLGAKLQPSSIQTATPLSFYDDDPYGITGGEIVSYLPSLNEPNQISPPLYSGTTVTMFQLKGITKGSFDTWQQLYESEK